ncbi:hypothetical protein QQF64_032153 [Cirrhinus molitorella]|uniref:Secreted protein n=1 Tax=Cirrhinus molitorella TaxID=172907 RepID=A0ABR3MYZ6_9TELE
MSSVVLYKQLNFFYRTLVILCLHLLYPKAAHPLLHLPPHPQEWTLTGHLYISLRRGQLRLNAPCPSNASLSGVGLQQGPGPRRYTVPSQQGRDGG